MFLQVFEGQQLLLLAGAEQRYAYYTDTECTLRISKSRVSDWKEYGHLGNNRT
jgi:hypothetical protein